MYRNTPTGHKREHISRRSYIQCQDSSAREKTFPTSVTKTNSNPLAEKKKHEPGDITSTMTSGPLDTQL